jgi:putative copper export protein
MTDVPDVVTGWNIQLYDIPYICKRLNRVLGEKLMKRFSNWGLVTEKELYITGRKHTTFDVGGLTQLIILSFIRSLLIKHKNLIVWIILLR